MLRCGGRVYVRRTVAILLVLAWVSVSGVAAELTGNARLEDSARELLKRRCIRCHGPALAEGGLDLTRPQPGGKHGAALVPGKPDQSPIWRRVARGEMPPGEPLPTTERDLLRRWIASTNPAPPRSGGQGHWAFQPLRPVPSPAVRDPSRVRTSVDRFIQAQLEAVGLSIGPEADRPTLIRRVAFDLTGLPPSPEETRAFVADPGPRAYEAMVERYLASPHYGQRWGHFWLDAAGYADSNGYFNADTDRPLAYRYRDYVIRSVQADKPWDEFIREQIAGDELAGYRPGAAVDPGMIPLLEATHFLRNSPDGTDSSDGNPDEQRADKYAALEGTVQIMGSALLGLTVQCARCHDHKFEPFTQRDYYQLQAVLFPAFHVQKWVKPAERVMESAGAGELVRWEAESRAVDQKVAALRQEFATWARTNEEPTRLLFEDQFDAAAPLGTRWSNTAPGDRRPAGVPAVAVDSPGTPAARVVNGALLIAESGSAGDRAVSTRAAFDWSPDGRGEWIEASFDLPAGSPSAPYTGFFLALRDFNDDTSAAGGNVLLDGAASGGAAIHVDYPGSDSRGAGRIGKSGYAPGHSFGVRVTNVGEGKFQLQQYVDGVPEDGTAVLTAQDLPDGGFGFEYCCGRSFAVDNVRIRASDPRPAVEPRRRSLREERQRRQAALDRAVREAEQSRPPRPGRIAAVTDVVSEPPEVRLLERGEYKRPGPPVTAAAPTFLRAAAEPASFDAPRERPPHGTGRRLAFARWLTRPGSRAAALLARVTVNRWWQHHLGTGLARTPDNLGISGSRPSHPELLDHLAERLVASGWRARPIHRLIVLSAAYRQASSAPPLALRRDPGNVLLSRYPLRRLDAEAIRDAMLTVSGELDSSAGGAYVPTTRQPDGDVVVDEAAGGRRMSVYLQRRRTQVPGFLEAFDTPSIVVNCTGRTPTTVPLQSLKLLNSEFVRRRAAGLAARLEREGGPSDAGRLRLAFELTMGRPPRPVERALAERFLVDQPARYAARQDRVPAAWVDLCQMLLASNGFLYVE